VLGCKVTKDIEVHHIRALNRKVNNNGVKSILNMEGKRVTGLPAVLSMLRRKQLPLCSNHHLEFKKGIYSQLDYEKLSTVLNHNSRSFPLPMPKNSDFLPILRDEDFTVEKKAKK
jgi:hypothetical protein